MPRIDPERLLKCLQPLLDPLSGAIKSCDEVDKILGLMSKFSKKLVSKCIYVNILRTSNINVVDLFMQRGGWGLVFGWTNEAVTAKNYPLLKEILQLLLQTPITISQLKENRFPGIIKNLSKDCEDLDTRNLSKQVVANWINVAKGVENHQFQSMEFQVGNLGMPIDHNTIANHSGNVHQDLGNLNVAADSLLNIDPSFIPDPETEKQLLDLDISNADLSTIDFNLDILGKVDPQPMEEGLSQVTSTVGAAYNVGGGQITELPTNIMYSNNNSNTYSIPTTINPAQNHQQNQPVKSERIDLIQVHQSAPKIYIKTIGGQKTVVQGLGSEPGQYCLLIKGDRNYVLKVKEPTAPAPAGPLQPREEPLQVPETTSSGIRTEDSTDCSSKVKRSKSHKKEKESKVSTTTNKPIAGASTLKTYGSSKSKTAVSKENTAHKRPSDQNAKPEKLEKEKKSLKESGSIDGHKKSKSTSSRSKAEAAAAAAKQLEDEEKLREQIRNQKALVKKRAKDAEKQKQQEKDQETLKKLNLAPPSATSPSSSRKIPKIPKKSTSFIDAIGIPGSDGTSSVDKIKKIAAEKKSAEESVTPSSPTKKIPGKKEDNETEDSEKPKERRHKPKVFVSTKSRSEDLLNEMTGAVKNKASKEKDKEKAKDEAKPISTLGNSIPAVPPKVLKRLSIDSIEKPGDPKKAKLVDVSSKADKVKDEKAKESVKDKEKKKPTIVLKESSLFMDMLTASTEPTKPSKRKRRLSTGNEKEKSEQSSPTERFPKHQNNGKEGGDDSDETREETGTPEDPVKKPAFNFYRDTLNDSPEEDSNEVKREQTDQVAPRGDVEEPMEQCDDRGSFTPQENDGKIKSALCLHRARNRPRKFVRWKDEDDLREFHYFEMDETERVNVTKQKDFTEMSQHEKAVEKSNIRRKSDDEEPQNQWRLSKTIYSKPVSEHRVTSQEKGIQEERESNILGLFLPPGSILPDAPNEPDPASPAVDRLEPKLIPVEDVNSITKVCDFRTHSWPPPMSMTLLPKSRLSMGTGYNRMPHEMENIPLNPPLNSFLPAAPDYNPWSTPSFTGVPPPPVPNIADMLPFQQFPPPGGSGGMNIGMNFLQNGPPAVMPFANPNPFSFPPPTPIIPHTNGPTSHGLMDSFGSNNRDGRMGGNRGGRFNNDSDQRRNIHGSRDRDGGGRDRGRDRDYRDDRGGRDRDFRRRERDRDNDRDHRHYDRDRNSRDYRSGSSGRNSRKDVFCRYFRKGSCSNGSRCEYSHDPALNLEDSKTSSRPDSYESGRSRRSPDSNNKDVDLRQSSTEVDDWDGEPSSKTPSTTNDVDATRFALPPSSPPPTDHEMPVLAESSESTKVIPLIGID